MNWGMISYEIPLARYPDTYNGQPLGVLALAAQKRHYSLYLNAAYASSELLEPVASRLRRGRHQVRHGQELPALPRPVRHRPRRHRRHRGQRSTRALHRDVRGIASSMSADHARPRLRAPPPLLGAGPWDAAAAEHADGLRRDPAADLVASRRRARPRHAAGVRTTRCARGVAGRDDRDRRPPRESERHRGQPRRHRRGLRRGRRAGRLRVRRDRPARRRRCTSGAGRERAVPSLRWSGTGRRPRRLHVLRRDAVRRRGTRPPSSVSASTSTSPRALPTRTPAHASAILPPMTGCSCTACSWTVRCGERSPTTRAAT